MTIENTEDLQEMVDQITADIHDLNQRISSNTSATNGFDAQITALNNQITSINQILNSGQLPTLTIQDNSVKTADNGALHHDAVNNSWRFLDNDSPSSIFASAIIKKGEGLYLGSSVASLKLSAANSNKCFKLKTPFKRSSHSMVQLTIEGVSYGAGSHDVLMLFCYNHGGGSVVNAFTKSVVGNMQPDVWVGYDAADNMCMFFGHGYNKYFSGFRASFMVIHGLYSAETLGRDGAFELSIMQNDGKPSNSTGNWLIGGITYYDVAKAVIK